VSNAPIARSKLTKLVFNHLKIGLTPANIVVGRGSAPEAGGWPQGQPNVSSFVDYVVLKTSSATTPAQGQPERLGVYGTSWACRYLLTYHSVKESSVDDVADAGRALLVQLPDELSLDGVTWHLQRVEFGRLGDTRPDNSTDPAHWTVTDDVSLHLSRVRAR
jgi:hypothetical protein